MQTAQPIRIQIYMVYSAPSVGQYVQSSHDWFGESSTSFANKSKSIVNKSILGNANTSLLHKG